MITRRQFAGGVAAGTLLSASPVRAQRPVIKIGVMVDLSGPYKDTGGETSVACARQAVVDSGVEALGFDVEILVADHQQKADIGVGIVRRWIDVDGLDAVAEVNNSAIALGVNGVIREKNKVFLASGPASAELTGKQCSPNTVHWALDTWCRAKGTGTAIVQGGGKSWYFVVPNYAFGHSLQEQTSSVVKELGGSVAGSSVYPFPSTVDFSSYLIAAQATRSDVLALANTASDLTTCMKQIREFGMADGKLRIAALSGFVTEMRAMGLETAQGLLLTETFYWDLNPRTRAFLDRVKSKVPTNWPNSEHAATYASVFHYLKSVAKVGPGAAKRSGRELVEAMKAMPTDDDCFGPGRIRTDGRALVPAHLFRVKKPADSSSPWDLYDRLATIPAEQAFRPEGAGGCESA